MDAADDVGGMLTRLETDARRPVVLATRADRAVGIEESPAAVGFANMPAFGVGLVREARDQLRDRFVDAQSWRSISIFLISAIARAGLSPLGQTLAQFMIVWQR